uniref:Uncharacterized protein n=1 Tax=Anguilla anguilla TaxID=7936 RepID=A0A0E9WZG8_ANGAN
MSAEYKSILWTDRTQNLRQGISPGTYYRIQSQQIARDFIWYTHQSSSSTPKQNSPQITFYQHLVTSFLPSLKCFFSSSKKPYT